MYWVSSKKDDLYGVTDTRDNVENFFTAKELFEIIAEDKVEIDGVDTEDMKICLVKLADDTVRLFKQGKVHLAVCTMTLSGRWFGLKFRSKPTGGEMSMVRNRIVNICRNGVNSYSIDMGTSKTYVGCISLDDVLMFLERFHGWCLTEVVKRRF